MRRDTLVILGIFAIAIGIGLFAFPGNNYSQNSSAVEDSASAAVQVSFTRITEGTQSEVSRRVNYLIMTQAGLQKLWNMVEASSTPPEIDFTKEVVIAVFAGEKPAAGYDIVVSKIEDMHDERVVNITLREPSPGCATAQVVTMPYEILRIPVTALPLTHEDTIQTVNCSD